MGKGTIISGGTDGIYQVKKIIERDRITAAVDRLTVRISDLTAKIAAMPSTDPDFLTSILQLESLQKKKDKLDDIDPDETATMHCADFTEDLTGNVGTIEIIGQDGTETGINIQPGYNSNAVYDEDRDGQVQNPWANHPMGALLDWMILPGVQKWIPFYRYGSITKIYDNDTCDITLENIESRAQDKNINQTSTLSGVPIDYMDCSGSDPFEVGHDVLINFIDNDWEDPVIVGYKANPVECDTCDWEPWAGSTICHTNSYEVFYDIDSTGATGVSQCPASDPSGVLYTIGDSYFKFDTVAQAPGANKLQFYSFPFLSPAITSRYMALKIKSDNIVFNEVATIGDPTESYAWLALYASGGTPNVKFWLLGATARTKIPGYADLMNGDKIYVDLQTYGFYPTGIIQVLLNFHAYNYNGGAGRFRYWIDCIDFVDTIPP